MPRSSPDKPKAAAPRRRTVQHRRPRVSRLLAWLLAAWLGGSGWAIAQVAPNALPTGGQVVVGNGQLSQQGKLLIIQQNSNKLGLDWQSFNIGSGATVEFRQPGASAIALNRVLGNSGSQIYGQLRANGQVFLTNPNGVLFAPGARVDVGGLVASTLDLTQQDFAEGRYVFNARGANGTSASVVNQGSLRASAGGYLALFGQQVANQGDIAVDAGSVVLASGRAATVSISGSGLLQAVVAPNLLPGSVDHSGRISADGGVVTLSAKGAQDIAASLVNNSGIVRANTLVQRGGEIWITGDNVASTGALSADATGSGDAGRIVVKGDLERGSGLIAGTISARAEGGEGGRIETSAARLLVADGTRVDTRSAGARGGHWLIDPTDFTVGATGVLTASGIGADTLSANLANTSVTLATAAPGGEPGDIHVNADVNWSASTTLTLQAARHINLNASITASGDAAALVLTPALSDATGSFNINTTATVTPKVTLSGPNASLSIAGVSYGLIRNLAGLQALDTTRSGNWALVADIDATGTPFNPIGDETVTSYGGNAAQAFVGRFDGLGHSITGLTINLPTSNSTGLFAIVKDASIRNLALLGGSVTGSRVAGGVVGWADGNTTLVNLRSQAGVTAVDDSNNGVYVGGLVGYMAGGNASSGVSRGVATGAVSGDTNVGTAIVGGAVGYLGSGVLNDTLASGTVTATARGSSGNAAFDTGGVVGRFLGNGFNGNTAIGAVSGGTYSGGLVGYYSSAGDLRNGRADGNVSGTGNVGGLVGQAAGAGGIFDSTATGTVTGTAPSGNVGGLAGQYTGAGGVARVQASGNVSGGSFTGGAIGTFNSAGDIRNASAGGTVTGAGQVGGLAATTSGTGGLYDSTAAGNVSSTGAGPAGGLVGSFFQSDGLQGSRADGNVSSAGGTYAGGLVGVYTSTGAVLASESRGNTVSGGTYVGGLIGYSTATSISGSSARAAVTATGTAGGLVGRSGGAISNSSASGNVSGTVNVGGLVGEGAGSGDYTDVTATGNVTNTTSGNQVGGLVGSLSSGGVSNGRATGSVTGGAYSGGLIGYYAAGGDIRNSHAEGSVSGATNVGGLVGFATGSGGLYDSTALGNVTATTNGGGVGGLVGQFSMAAGMQRAEANGNVSGGAYTGGLVGYYNTTGALVTGTARAATVSGNTWVGGLLGYSNASSITGGTASATVTSNDSAGGLAGHTGGSVTDSSASGSVSGGSNSYVGGLIGQAAGTGALTDVSASGTVTASGSSYVGGLAGESTATGGILRGLATGAVSGGVRTGGLVGNYSSAGDIREARAEGNASGIQHVGGLVGISAGASGIYDSLALGSATSSTNNGGVGGLVGQFGQNVGIFKSEARGNVSGGTYGGGLVGYFTTAGTLTESFSLASTVSSGAYAGGLVGYSAASAVSKVSAVANVTATTHAGGLMGRSGGSLSEATATGNVVGTGNVGGLVGESTGGGDIADVQASGTVAGSASGNYVGGLIGYLSAGSVTRASATGTVVAGGSYTGGLIGLMTGGGGVSASTASGNVAGGAAAGGLVGYFSASGSITSSGATGSVLGTSYVGGLVGNFTSGGSIVESTAAGAVTAGTYGGGLVGFFGYSTAITDSRATGSVNSGAVAGGLVGYAYDISGGINNSSATGAVVGNTMVGGLVGELEYTNVSRGSASGDVRVVTESTAYVGGLVGYYYSNRVGAAITLSTATGRVFSDAPGSRVGGLVGEVGLGNVSLSNAYGSVTAQDSLNVNSSSHYTGGLVGLFSGNAATSISGSSAAGAVEGRYYAGGLVGYYQGQAALSDVSAQGNVTGTQVVGGLIGQLYYAGISNGTASGRVTATATSSAAGGLVGSANLYYTDNTIRNSSASGNVSGGAYAGGLVGNWESSNSGATNIGIADSRASGNVNGRTYVGGLVGSYTNPYANNDAGISRSSALGDVRGESYVGGLVGYFNGYGGIRDASAAGDVVGASSTAAHFLGGLVGQYTNTNSNAALGQLARSTASGSVSLAGGATLGASTDVYAGGLVGYASSASGAAVVVSDSYAAGDVTLAATSGRLRAGGLVGYTGSSLARTYATGAVSASGGNTRVAGGLAAEKAASATASSSYWASDTSGQATSVLGSARTLAQLETGATFTGWDIATEGGSSSVWRQYEGNTTPLLRALLTPATVTLGNVSKTYDGSAALTGATLLAGASALDHPERVLVAGTAVDAGTYALDAANLYSVQNGYDLSVAGNGVLTINRRPLGLNGLVQGKVYDATAAATLAAGAQPFNLVAGEDLVFQPGAGFDIQFADKNAGAAKLVNIGGSYSWIDGVRGKASNYLMPTANTTTAAITPALLTAGSFSATNRAYNGSTTVDVSATAAALSGVLGNDNVSVDLASVSSGTVADKNVGTGKAVTVLGAALTGADAGNYTLAGIGSVFVDITPKVLTVNGITATNRVYNAGTSVSLVTSGAFLSGLVGGDLVEAKVNSLSGTVADKNAEDGKPVTVTGLGLRGPDAGNYTAQQGAVSVNITRRALTVQLGQTAQTNRLYDGTTNASVSIPQTWLGGDNIVVTTTAIGFADKNVAYNNAGAVTSKTITASGIEISGTDANNYTLQNTTATTTGTISPRSLAVGGITAVNRVYDGTRDVVVNVAGATVNTSNVVLNDDVAVTLPSGGTVTGQMANKNVGTGKAVTVPGLTLSGVDAGNYTLNNAGNGVTVDISRKNVTATYTAADRVYDGTVYVIARAASDDLVAGDAVSFYTNDNPYYTGYTVFTGVGAKNVGTAKPVAITFDRLQGTDATNYTFVNAGLGTTTASVTPKPVNLAFNGVTKVYDGSTNAMVSLNFGSSGLYGGDVLTATSTAQYTGVGAKNVGNNKPISVSNIALSGADAFNYTVGNTTANTTGAVTAKPVQLSGITAVNRPYDGTTTVAVTAQDVTSSGFIGGDNVAVALPQGGLTTGTIANKNVGINKPVTVTGLTLSGTDAGNYAIDIVGSGITVDIGAKAITPSFTGNSRAYNGDVNASVTASLADIVAGDNVSFVLAQTPIYTGADARNVGTAKPVSITGISLSGSAAGNYSLLSTTATTTADITPKPVTATYTAGNRVYNGLADTSVSVLGASLQLINGDDVGFTQTAAILGDGRAGVGRQVAVSNIALGGSDARNYSLVNTSASTTVTIDRRPLGVTGVTATDRAYDGTTTVAVNVAGATVDTGNLIAGDVVTVTLPPNGISTGTMADRHVGAGKTVSITGLDVSGAAAANYTLIGATGLTVNITPKALTASYTGVDKVYNGNAAAQVLGSSADIYAIDAGGVFITATGVFTGADGRNAGTDKAVAVSGGVLGGAQRENYALVNTSGATTASIAQRQVTVNYQAGLSKVYDGTTAAPAAGTLANLVSGDSVTVAQTAEFTGAGGRNVGNGKTIAISGISLQGSDAANYVLSTASASTTGGITPKPITVSGLNSVVAQDRTYDGTRDVVVSVPQNVALVPSSADIVAGDNVVIAVPAGGITSGTVASKNAGTGKVVTVSGLTLGGSDGGNYSIAGTAGITVDITPKALTATYLGTTRVYNGNTNATAIGQSDGIINGDNLVITGAGVFTGAGARNVGSNKAIDIQQASLTGTDRFNYTLLNTTGTTTGGITPLEVTAAYFGESKVYDGTNAATVRASSTGFIAGDAIALSQGAVFRNGKNVGNNLAIDITGITLTGADAGNYALRNTTALASGSITPRPLRIDGLTGVTADNRVYDGTTVVNVTVTTSGALTPNAQDLVAGDVVTVNAPSAGSTTGSLDNKNAGNGKAVRVNGLTLGGSDGANYSITATSGITVNIARKALTAVYLGQDKVYDGTAAATVIGSSADIIGGDMLSISGSGVFSNGKNVGIGKLINVTSGVLGSTDAANYTLLNPLGSATASITPRTVNAVFTGGTRVYDGSVLAPVQGSVSGAIAGDELALLATPVFTGPGAKNVGVDKAVAVTGIALQGGDAGNYRLAADTTSTTATVTPKALRIDGLTGVSALDRVYDGTSIVAVNVATSGAVTPNAEDLVAGDVVTITAPPAGSTTGTMLNKNAGTNKAVTVAGLTLGGADALNYSVAATSGVTVNIAQRELTAVYGSTSRVYDGTAAVLVNGSSADILLGDIVSVLGDGLFTGAGAKNVGVGKTVAVSGGRLAGVDGSNYRLLNTSGSTTGTITPKLVSATYAGLSKVYDGTTNALVSGSTTGFIEGDAVGLNQTAVFTGLGARNVGNGKAVLVSGITLTGGDAINYALINDSVSTTGSITPRPLRVNGLTGVVANDRVYDGTVNVNVSVLSSGALSPDLADVIAGDVVSVELPAGGISAGTMADKNVGNNKAVTVAGLTLGGADGGNYAVAAALGVTVNITPRQLTASYIGLDKVYDGTAAAQVGGSSADIVAGDLLSISGNGVFSGGKNAGLGKAIVISDGALLGADRSNYTLLNSTGVATANITPRQIAPAFTGGTRVYDGTVDAPVTLSGDGLIGGDAVSLLATAVFTGAGAKNVGSNKQVAVSGITLSGTDAVNYQLLADSASTTASITPRPVNVSGLGNITAVDRVYDGTRNVQINISGATGTATGDFIVGDDVAVNVPAGGLSAGLMVDKNVGSNKAVAIAGLTLAGLDAANYQITGTTGVTVTIAPKPVVLLGVRALDRVYDGSTAVAISTAGGSIAGAVAGDDLQLPGSGVSGRMADKHVGSGKAVQVSGLTLAGSDAGNYVVESGGDLRVNITPRPLVASLTVADKVYDGSTTASVTLAGNGVLAGDDVSLASGGATFDNKDAGRGKAVTVQGLALGGGDAGDYVLTGNTGGLTANILPAPLLISAGSLSKVYGETVNLSFSAQGLVLNENIGQVTLSSAGSAASATVNGGPYAITVADARGGSFNPSNYALSYTSGVLLVTPRPVTVVGNIVVRVAGDANPAYIGTLSNDGISVAPDGLVFGDTLAGAVLTAPAGSNNAAGGALLELVPNNAQFAASVNASNYSLRYVSGLLVVLPRPPSSSDNSGGGGTGFAVEVSQAEIERALAALERSSGDLARLRKPGEPALPGLLRAAEASDAEISVLLDGDSRRITLPALLKLPLISFDPALRRLTFRAPAASRP
jgi:filamentous hemagglutinin family protein